MNPRQLLPLLLLAALGCQGNLSVDQNNASSPGSPPGSSATPGQSTSTSVKDAPTTSVSATSRPTSPSSTTGTNSNAWDHDAWPDLERTPTPPVMRRLTRREYNHVVTDLLGLEDGVADVFPPEESVRGHRNNSAALTYSPVLAEQSLAVSERLGVKAVEIGEQFAPCVKTVDGVDEGCAKRFVEALGLRAWRRPLSQQEVQSVVALFTQGQEQEGAKRGLEMAATMLFYSLPFFYRVEQGKLDAQGIKRPTSWEFASRLSFLYWQSAPDDVLLELAAKDQLQTPAQLLAQAERLLKDPRAHRATDQFHESWFHLERIRDINKDPEFFKAWDNDYPSHMAKELHLLLDHLAWQPEGSYMDLFSTTTTFVNKPLRQYYGLSTKGSDVDTFEKVELSLQDRQGVLTRGGIIAMEGFNQTSPILRGHYIRQQLLCDLVPEPPASVDNAPLPLAPDATTRERVEARTETGSCAGCHTLMNGIGFGLERYDAGGWVRTMENGRPLNLTGDVVNSDLGAFEGANELSTNLMRSDALRSCFVRQWFRQAYGRLETWQDIEDLEQMTTAMKENQGRYRVMLLSLIETDAFLNLRPSQGTP